jgi:hypothetical protein
VSYLSALFSDVSSPGKRAALSSMTAEAQTGGDFAADTDLDLSVDVLFGVFWYRVLTGDRPLDPAVAHALVAGLLQATRPA